MIFKGPFELRGEECGVERSRVELAENKLILDKIYFTSHSSPSLPQSKLTTRIFTESTFSILCLAYYNK